MLASVRNRCRWNVDNPMDGDGFYRYFKGRRVRGSRKNTGKLRRRTLRRLERREYQREDVLW